MRAPLTTAALLAVIALATAGCDDPPSAPSPASGPLPTTTRIEISGPGTIAPGVPATFSAIAHLSDGSTRDVTALATWRTSSVDFTISQPGVLTARRTGAATLTAAHVALTSTREIISVPEGTFRLTGVVIDETPPAGPVSMARIDVLAGGGRGLGSFTDARGQYAIYGVSGDVELRITKAGYHERIEAVTVLEHRAHDIRLAIETPRPNLSGSWALTISADPQCHPDLPEDAWVRKYTALLTQVGPTLDVQLTNASMGRSFGQVFDRFQPGLVELERVVFHLSDDLGYYYFFGPPFLEQLGGPRFFTASGRLGLEIAPNRLAGELDGWIEIREGPQPYELTRGPFCASRRHEFVFVK